MKETSFVLWDKRGFSYGHDLMTDSFDQPLACSRMVQSAPMAS